MLKLRCANPSDGAQESSYRKMRVEVVSGIECKQASAKSALSRAGLDRNRGSSSCPQSADFEVAIARSKDTIIAREWRPRAHQRGPSAARGSARRSRGPA